LVLKVAQQALVFAGSMTFNPATDSIPDKNGKPFKFKAPYGTPPSP
jgi:aconitate hydratase